MCGIAGYNVSPVWAENFTPVTQKKILQEAWLHNLHRGADAAGYFALKNDNAVKVYKKDADAATILTKNLRSTEIPPARVFGAHTRAMTKGDAKVIENNHPVYYNGIWVTHNGSIRNDEEIKKTVSGNVHLAEVDSIAIPIKLAEIETPLDIPDLRDVLRDLQGGYAFHAIWRQYPGLSLLAKGDTSPLLLAIHDYGAVLYASVVEALWSMIDAMGLDPKDNAWKYYSVKDDGAIVVVDGRPVAWDDFSEEDSKEIVSRIVPAMGPERKPEIIYTSKGKYDFAQKNGPGGRDLALTPRTDLVYTNADGFVDKKLQYPRLVDTDIHSVTSEADKVVKNTLSGNHHVFFGDIEIIMSGRVVMDIYDHSKFPTEARWFTDPKIEVPLTTFDDFVEAKTTKIMQLPNPSADYQYAKSREIVPLGRKTGVEIGTKHGGRKGLSSKTEGLKLVRPDPVLVWANIWSIVTDHDDLKYSRDGFIYMNSKLSCPVHDNVLMHKHPEPDKCGHAKASAAYALSCAGDLDVLDGMIPNTHIVETTGKKECKSGQHDIYGTVYFEIILESGKYFEILIEEECMDCNTQWKLENIPFWILNIVGGKKDLMVGYGNQ